jgi:hypothetical protein
MKENNGNRRNNGGMAHPWRNGVGGHQRQQHNKAKAKAAERQQSANGGAAKRHPRRRRSRGIKTKYAAWRIVAKKLR